MLSEILHTRTVCVDTMSIKGNGDEEESEWTLREQVLAQS